MILTRPLLFGWEWVVSHVLLRPSLIHDYFSSRFVMMTSFQVCSLSKNGTPRSASHSNVASPLALETRYNLLRNEVVWYVPITLIVVEINALPLPPQVLSYGPLTT